MVRRSARKRGEAGERRNTAGEELLACGVALEVSCLGQGGGGENLGKNRSERGRSNTE